MPETLWALAEHTRGKHLVLRRYLDAWLPILTSRNERIVFVDGFAGPGRYSGGEDGSPLIALKAFRDHASRQRMTSRVSFFFIEKEEARAEHLVREVEPYRRELGTEVHIEVMPGVFDATMTSVLDAIEEQRKVLAPAFVMVDPFGVSGTPMSILERILRNPQSELYVSFMWEFFNRFRDTPEFQPHLDELFGTSEWRRHAAIPNWRDRKQAIFGLYRAELKRRGASQVIHFELYEGASLVYAIFFATKHPLGSDKMKEAIWKVDPFSGHAFVPGAADGFQLFREADLGPLKSQLRAAFGGRDAPVADLESWIRTDDTFFWSGQLRKALKELERQSLLSVREGTRKKRGTYPAGTVLRLTPP